MKTFTYLIGAGASAKTLPVISNFGERLRNFWNELKGDESLFIKPQENQKDSNTLKDQLINKIKWLEKECNNHSTIDTFAKKLYLRNEEIKLVELKFIVSEFLRFEETFRGIDRRYETFFATILETSQELRIKLPCNLKIMSWNYDKQVERAYSRYLHSYTYRTLEGSSQIIPGYGEREFNNENFGMTKINGTCSGSISSDGEQFNSIDFEHHHNGSQDDKKKDYFNELLNRYENFKNEILKKDYYKESAPYDVPSILYSWETNTVSQSIKKAAIQIAEETNFLIVIGYSFPTFNRKYDRDILNRMKNIERIYVQDINPDGVIQRLKALLQHRQGVNYDKMIVPIKDVDEFYIPYQFD